MFSDQLNFRLAVKKQEGIRVSSQLDLLANEIAIKSSKEYSILKGTEGKHWKWHTGSNKENIMEAHNAVAEHLGNQAIHAERAGHHNMWAEIHKKGNNSMVKGSEEAAKGRLHEIARNAHTRAADAAQEHFENVMSGGDTDSSLARLNKYAGIAYAASDKANSNP